MKLCPSCQTTLKDDVNFCNICGCNVKEAMPKEEILKLNEGDAVEKTDAVDETAEDFATNSNDTDVSLLNDLDTEDSALPQFVTVSELKRCAGCGAELKKDVKFCIKCGARAEGGLGEPQSTVIKEEAVPPQSAYTPPLSIPPDRPQKSVTSKGKTIGLMFGFIAVFLLGGGAGYVIGNREVLAKKNVEVVTPTPTVAVSDKPEPTTKETVDITVTPVVIEVVVPDEGDLEQGIYTPGEVLNLAPYKGVEVTYYTMEITDADVQAHMESVLVQEAEYREPIDRVDVRYGDFININYVGTIDGKEFYGGTDNSFDGTDLAIGENFFFPEGFETQLIGARIGQEVLVTVTFAEDYYDAEVAGKEVKYKVTVNKIEEKVIPELTDEYVAGHQGYATVEQWKEAIRVQLNNENDHGAFKLAREDAIQEVVDSSKVSGIAQKDIDASVNKTLEFYKNYAAYFNTDLSGLISTYFNMEYEDFLEELVLGAEEQIRRNLVLSAVAQAEGIQMSDKEYQERLLLYAEENYYTVEELKQEYLDEELEAIIFLEMAGDVIAEHMVYRTP